MVSDAGRHRIAEELRERIAELPIAAVMPEQDRRVRDRNRVERPLPIDVVYLDDVWQVLDDFAAIKDSPDTPNGGTA